MTHTGLERTNITRHAVLPHAAAKKELYNTCRGPPDAGSGANPQRIERESPLETIRYTTSTTYSHTRTQYREQGASRGTECHSRAHGHRVGRGSRGARERRRARSISSSAPRSRSSSATWPRWRRSGTNRSSSSGADGRTGVTCTRCVWWRRWAARRR